MGDFGADKELKVTGTVFSEVRSEGYWKGEIGFSYDHFDGLCLIRSHLAFGFEVVEEPFKCM